MVEIHGKPKSKDKVIMSYVYEQGDYMKCDVCGREIHKAISAHGYKLCSKHYTQLKKYGKFLDNNPRTQKDKNEFVKVNDKYSKYYLYDLLGNRIAEGFIDNEDVDKVKNIKWNYSHGYANCRNKKTGSMMMHRKILDTTEFVDHINHNKLDNRKRNLRIVTKSQNQMNANYKGVYERKDHRYMSHIKKNGIMVNLGVYEDKEEAYWVRWYAEKLVFKEYAYPKDEPFILESRKEELKELVHRKVQRLDIPA